MKKERIHFSCDAIWRRPKARNGEPYIWGLPKSARIEEAWSKQHLIYRWVRSTDHKVAVVGEAKRQLGKRVDSYLAGKECGKGGVTNKRVWLEQQRLKREGAFLYLEYLVELDGFDFTLKHERRGAEGLLTAFYRPYCGSEAEA
jgi:hypothetical protein